MFSKIDIQRLKDLSVEEVASKLNLSVFRHKALCPFHEDRRPSLTFNVRKNRYRCFVCDASGSSIDLVMKSQGWNFYESCKWLAKEFGVTTSEDLSYFEAKKLTAHKTSHTKRSVPPPPIDVHHLEVLMAHPVQTQEAQQFLFEERKLSPQVVKQIGISSISEPVPMSGNPNGSWFNAPSLLIPYRDVNGSLISVQARHLGQKEFTEKPQALHDNSSFQEKPRFQFPRGSRCGIFNLPILRTLEEGAELWITEGVTDCLAMMSFGRKAIAIPSATLLNADDIKLLSTWSRQHGTTFHMAPDNDAPGERLFLELQKLLPSLEHHLLPARYKDFGAYFQEQKSLELSKSHPSDHQDPSTTKQTDVKLLNC